MGVIAWFTLRPSPEGAEAAAASSFLCLFPCGDQSVRDAILNTLLFIPLGFGLRLWLPGLRSWLLTLLATCAIEFTQYAWLLGRDASFRDILTNALGGAIGVGLVSGWPLLLRPAPRRSRRMTLAALGAWVVIVAGGAVLIRPALPRSIYWGQWAPELGQFDTWHGALLDLRVNGISVPRGRLGGSARLRELLLQDSVMVQVQIITGPPPEHVAPIASVFDSEQREIFVLGQRGADLVFRIRTGIRALELGGQMVALRDAVHGTGDTLEIAAGIDRGAWVITVDGPGRMQQTTRLPFSAGLIWSGLVPFELLLDRSMLWLSALWIGGLLLPAGYWLWRSDRRIATLAALIAGAVLALGLVASGAGLASPTGYEWGATVLGPAAGWLLSRTGDRWLARGAVHSEPGNESAGA